MNPHRLYSIFLIILLLSMPSVYAFQIPGTDIDIGADDVAVFLGAAAVTAAVLITAPVSVPAAVIAGAAVVAGVGATWAYNTYVKGSEGENENKVTDGKIPTDKELVNDSEIKETFWSFYQDVEDEGLKDLLTLRQQLQSSLVRYDFDAKGSLADIRVSIKGPDKIYGFSAFPISINIYAPCPTDPKENKVHIQKISVYVKDVETGRIWWRQSWSGDVILRNKDHTWYFILKAPDLYYGKVKSMINGTANKKILDELLNAEIPKYEICVEIYGYREVWVWKTIKDENGHNKKVLEHERDDPINVKLISLSAWLHENSGIYEINGAEGSLPIKFANMREYTTYKMKANGAISNLILRIWATPTHVIGSTADYKLCFIANPNYFDPLKPTIIDDVAIITFRTQYDGSTAIASQVKDSFGDLGTINMIATSMHYKASGNTTAFDTYVVMYAVVKTEDENLPIWLVAKPAITVLSNREVVLADERVKEIASILKKENITEEDIKQIKQVASTMISGLKSKEYAALSLKSRCANNKDAKKYAELAITYYNKALKALELVQATDDPNQIATQIKLAKNYEMIADYYTDAAEKVLYGHKEQAEINVRNAQKIIEVTKKYEPTIWFKAGSYLGDAWQSFKEGFGIGDVPDWVLILIVIIFVVGVAIIVLKFF